MSAIHNNEVFSDPNAEKWEPIHVIPFVEVELVEPIDDRALYTLRSRSLVKMWLEQYPGWRPDISTTLNRDFSPHMDDPIG